MLNLLLEESMDAYGPSREEIIASNVLSLLSSTGLSSASISLQKSKELSSSELDHARFLLQESKGASLYNHSRSSSTSTKSFENSMKRDFFVGLGPVSRNSADVDDDGLHGDRMKPLSSVENNCEMRARFSIPQFSKRRGSHSPANSKVLAASRVGRRARCKAMCYNSNKENLVATHMKEMQETCLKHKGVKRKSAGHEVNARFLALKRKRSTLSSWQTTISVPIITSSVSNVAATPSILDCKETQHPTKATHLSSRQVAHPLLGVPKDVEYIQGKEIVLQEDVEYIPGKEMALEESTDCQAQIVALPCSTFLCLQNSGLPLTDFKEESSCSSRADPAGHEQVSSTKGDDFVGGLCRKPPAYPKANQSTPTIHDQKCSSHLLVDASCGKGMGDSKFHDQESMIEAQCSSSKLTEMQRGYAKVEEGSEDLGGPERACHLVGGMHVGVAGCSVSHIVEPLAGAESCNIQAEMCKIPAGPSPVMLSSNKSDGPCLRADKVLILTQPLCFENATTVSSSGGVVELAQVKQEASSQDSAEMNSDSHIVNSNCELLPRHHSAREHIKESARKPPVTLHNALELRSQLGVQKPKDHKRAWGLTLYQQSQHNNVGLLPKLRRGRPPRKSNLCPCPEPKEQADKFAQICAPSGVFGKLNPGIITRLRDKKQVHAVLEAVIRGAFMTGMKENVKLQRLKGAEDANADKGAHDKQKDKASECRDRAFLKAKETASDGELDLKLGFTDQKANATSYLRGEDKKQRHPPGRSELNSLNGKNTLSGTFGVRKQEQCLPEEHAVPDFNLLKCGSLPTSATYSMDARVDIHEVSEVNQNKVCSAEALGDQKVLGYNISSAGTPAVNAKGNVASCWLELLRLDIKGRLSALKRSKRRVRGIIVSGQLDAGNGKANQVDEMEQWRAFFMHMENVLCSEGTRLESWLNQITEMQLSYCQKKSGAGNMLPLCASMGPCIVDMNGASR